MSGRSELGGFTLSGIIWYLAMTETLMLARARTHIDIGEAVKSGDIAYTLNKPYSYPLFQWANTVGTSLVRFVINFFVGVATVLVLTRTLEGSLPGLLGFVVLALLSLVLDAGISVLIGMCAFVIEEVRPLDWMYQKLVFTIGGMFIPLDVFPDWLRAVSSLLPFKYLVYAPARTFVRFDPNFFVESLAGKAEATISTYQPELRQFLSWVAARPGNSSRFRPDHMTKTALETYLIHLERAGHSISHRARAKSAVASFARWLIEEKDLLRRNPARGVTLPPQPLMAPRQLTPDQRYFLINGNDPDGMGHCIQQHSIEI